MKKKRSIGIHDGAFHADEVTACALLAVFDRIDCDKIVRTRDPGKLAECEYVCDVGGVYDPSCKLFDHHQASYQGDLSSAGMILHYLLEEGVLSQEEYQHFNSSIFLGIDAHDNGRSYHLPGYCTFSHVIANYNPEQYESSEEILDKAFFEALEFAKGHLMRMHRRFLYTLACRKLVKETMEHSDSYLMFSQSLPWLEGFFALGGKTHPALFVVMPTKEHWKLRGIPPDDEHRMQVRLPLPQAWAGLLGDELKAVSGIQGAVFCHKGRFTSVWETKEDALKALDYVLKANGISPHENSI